MAPEGLFLNRNPHPRAYGSFARVLAKYVRDEGLITLQEAVRRLTSLPADNLRLARRGRLADGYYADVVVFDPAAVQDYATPEQPHQYATGMKHVFVNGVQVLKDGEHTGATPGRFVRGPGWGQTIPYATDYPAALHPFLTLGEHYSGTYIELEAGREHIPDLIRLATDERLLRANRVQPHEFAPIHAWRRLGQMRAKEAAQPLTVVLGLPDPLIVEELPQVYALIGPEAIPTLADVLADSEELPFGRVTTLSCLRVMADEYPQVYDLCVSLMLAQLEQHAQNGVMLNSFLVQALVGMGVADAAELIVRAYSAGEIWTEIAGTLKDNLVKLGVAMSPEMRALLGRANDDTDDTKRRRAAARRADAKKKAKRKQSRKK
jgi:hypothetical protein